MLSARHHLSMHPYPTLHSFLDEVLDQLFYVICFTSIRSAFTYYTFLVVDPVPLAQDEFTPVRQRH